MLKYLLLIIAVLPLCGCPAVHNAGQVKVDEIAGSTTAVLDRYEVYTAGDESLIDLEREGRLAESAALDALLDANAGGTIHVQELAAMPVICDRHDAYVRADDSLTALRFDLYLTTSDIVRSTITKMLSTNDDD